MGTKLNNVSITIPQAHENNLIFALISHNNFLLTALKCPNDVTLFMSDEWVDPDDANYNVTNYVWGTLAPSSAMLDTLDLSVRVSDSSRNDTIVFLNDLKRETESYHNQGIHNWETWHKVHSLLKGGSQ